ncbi:MAG: zf-HC2 domain-containing protein [Deltaproteobacteria bacterium]|nr:zf-HC2 domain-containing protein [Deltaproteobacteria bacterium]
MDCRTARKLLEPWHDGLLPAPQRPGLEEHLHGCPACSEALQEIEELGALLSGGSVLALPGDLAVRIVREAAALEPPVRGHRSVAGPRLVTPWWLRTVAASAALVVVAAGVAAGLWAFSGEPRSQKPMPALAEWLPDEAFEADPRDPALDWVLTEAFGEEHAP